MVSKKISNKNKNLFNLKNIIFQLTILYLGYLLLKFFNIDIFSILGLNRKNIEGFNTEEYPVYITLTTLPERIISNHFKNVIEYLLNQNVKFEKIILNVPHVYKRENKKYVIPEWLSKHPKIQINRCEDIGPITKLYPTIDIIPDKSLILVVDDDIIYKENLLKDLLNKWKDNQNSVISYRTTVRKINNKIYKEPNGYSGFLLKKELLKDIRKLDFPDICNLVDDNYLGWCFLKLNIPVIDIGGWNFWYPGKTDEHPKWKELVFHTDRHNRVKKCVNALKVFT